MTIPDIQKLLTEKKFLFVFAIIVSFIVIFHRLGEMPLAGDDCYYSGVAREMARTGDYLTPRNAFGPDFHTSKPPVLYWLNAFSGKIFGFNAFAMKLPSAILCFLCVLAVLFFADRYFNYYTAFFSALILTFTQQYLYHARSAVTDGPFAVFFSLTLIFFWMARSEKKNIYFYLMGFCAGLAVMTRQIPGLFVFAVIILAILLLKEFKILLNPHFYFGLMLAVAVIAPWHIIMYLKYKKAFLDQYLSVALMTGIKGYPATYSGNPSLNPWYAYFEILVSNYWPWLPFLIIGIYKWIKSFSSIDIESRKKIIFVLLWAFVPFLMFQAAKVKQYHYIVPLYVPFALISAAAFEGFKFNIKIKSAFWLIIITTLLSVSYLFYPIIPKTLDSREYLKNMQFLEEAKRIDGDIIALNKWFSYYNNFLWFYADKRLVKNTPEEIVDKIKSQNKYNFVMSKEMFKKMHPLFLNKPLNIIKETEETVLFSVN
ncbi:MAG: glycosyltransferase family 39 protein [Elusimicrobia bacterium]|nr:glycosyltransferase family 39 protein [Elusimicrobiota bacterium]